VSTQVRQIFIDGPLARPAISHRLRAHPIDEIDDEDDNVHSFEIDDAKIDVRSRIYLTATVTR
jgi:hypothetical protein